MSGYGRQWADSDDEPYVTEQEQEKGKNFRSGYVAIIGRPNVGKSTLLNTILGEKISIVTPRPQTTQKRTTGIKTTDDYQIIFIDTPGIHKPQHRLGEFMVREARDAFKDVDIILLVVDPQPPGQGDRFIASALKEAGRSCPVMLLINKTDLIKRPEVLPVIDAYSKLFPFEVIIPMSAMNAEDVAVLTNEIVQRLPQGPRYYPDDVITDQYERSVVADLVREKVMEETADEVPHAVAVEVVEWKERDDGMLFLSANIYVEREGQKGIIIGKAGRRLKMIGSAARLDIERFLGKRVFLELWVKVRQDWRSNERVLRELGFD